MPLFVGPDAGNGNLLDTISIDATNPFNPFGVTLDGGSNCRRLLSARRFVEERPAQLSARRSTRSTLTATLDGKFELLGHNWYWDVNAVFGLNEAQQLVHRQRQRRRTSRRRWGRSRNAPRVRAVQHLRRRGLDHAGDARLTSRFDRARQQPSRRVNDYTANLSGELFDLPGGPVGIAVGYEHRHQSGASIPIRSSRPGSARTFRHSRRSGQFNVDEVYGEICAAAAEGHAVLPTARAERRGAPLRLFDLRRQHDAERRGYWKPVCRPAAARLLCARASARRRSANCSARQSRFDQELVDPCSRTPAAPTERSPRATSAPIASRRACPPTAAMFRPTPDLASSPAATPLRPEKSESKVLGAVFSPAAAPLLGRGNYYWIKVRGAIQAINANTTLQRCPSTMTRRPAP